MLGYMLVDTDLGWVGLVGSSLGLKRVVLPKLSWDDALQSLSLSATDAVWDAAVFGDLPDRLRRYLVGQRVLFLDKLDFTGDTVFCRAVWEVTRGIPFGETRSYAWVAQQVGRSGAARAVGQAMAKNPFPLVVPCHRVIAYDGSLGRYGRGLAMKRYLLELESGCHCLR